MCQAVDQRPRQQQEGGGTDVGVPVILVPGFGRASGLELVQRHLTRAGFGRVVTARYNPRVSEVPDIAAHLSRLVDTLLETSGRSQVHLVGHNLGGIAIRYYVQVLGGASRVDTAITIGAPHAGQRRAHMELGPSARRLVQGSSLVRLLEHSTAPCNVRWIAFHSVNDQLVSPRSSAVLTHPMLNASNVALDDERHLSVQLSPPVARAIANELTSATPRP